MSLVPESSTAAYELFYMIEIGLREFLIDTFGRNNQKWWKRRLPADVLIKMKEGRERERNIKWVDLTPHHPLYYVDFPDLRKTIERAENWRDAFQSLLGDKQVYCGALRELEPVRNKIAHNRRIVETEVTMLRTNYSILERALGKERWEGLIQVHTTAPSLHEVLVEMRDRAGVMHRTIARCRPLQVPTVWETTRSEWWFDADYLGVDLSPIDGFYDLAAQYASLPRSRGSGPSIEKWVRRVALDDAYSALTGAFAALLHTQRT